MRSPTGLTVQLPLVGHITAKADDGQSFVVEVRSGDRFTVFMRATTWWDSLTNLDRLSRMRLPIAHLQEGPVSGNGGWLATNVGVGDLIAVEGIYQLNGTHARYDAMTVHLLKSHAGYYLFEHTHWWKGQIEAMANKWLDVLFGETRTYALDDFSAMYRTTLSIEGAPTDDSTQEMATLSRLIYGLSSAYLLGGDERYFLAARAGVEYQREAFRSYSADGRFCFWLHARRRDRHGVYDVLPSLSADDAGTLPLYEQIYALAGLAQYDRITNDWETLQDIRRTMDMIDEMFADPRKSERGDAPPAGGYFSHIDAVSFLWNDPALGPNRAQKNWNSIGDHLPAYLINLILSLDPLPQTADIELRGVLERTRRQATEMLEVTAELILRKFPERDASGARTNPYVRERFTRDFEPIEDWRWQQNRAVVGHNLKIAWNLTRVANFYRGRGGGADQQRADELFAFARAIGDDMSRLGIDQVRSGVYDVVERVPADPQTGIQFGWWNTKDFWQQEQGILAYLVMAGYARSVGEADVARRFTETARELNVVWNLYFLDRERAGIFFRVSDNGIPVLSSTYGDKGGHSISGYHAFELDYLAHVYQCAYLPRRQRQHTTFCLHFRPSPNARVDSINVLPDFLGPESVEVAAVEIDGVPRAIGNPLSFQIPLQPDDLGRHVRVFLRQTQHAHDARQQDAIDDRRFPGADDAGGERP